MYWNIFPFQMSLKRGLQRMWSSVNNCSLPDIPFGFRYQTWKYFKYKYLSNFVTIPTETHTCLCVLTFLQLFSHSQTMYIFWNKCIHVRKLLKLLYKKDMILVSFLYPSQLVFWINKTFYHYKQKFSRWSQRIDETYSPC